MFTVPELAAKALGSYLAKHLKRRFGSTEVGLTELIPSAARLALDRIGNSDALYHNVEHTMLVTLVGYDIMRGRALLIPTDSSDFIHLIIACLFHDIGYVRGILQGDSPHDYVINANGEKIVLRTADGVNHLVYSEMTLTDDGDRLPNQTFEFRQPPREICQALGFKRTVINHNVTALSQDLAEDTEEMPVGGPDRQPRGIQSAPVLLPAVFARGQTTERGCGHKGACRSIAGEPDKPSRSP